ncbi:hypothetical protein L208DRAFT_180372 [Tricholoma matsutake]|nr:hypothetical protein L208DRAFT_180372 [Tricholoma matsutake 945]
MLFGPMPHPIPSLCSSPHPHGLRLCHCRDCPCSPSIVFSELQWLSVSPIVVVIPIVLSLPSPLSRHSHCCSPFSPRKQLLAVAVCRCW